MKKLAVIAVATLGFLAGEAAAQGGYRPPGAQTDPNAPPVQRPLRPGVPRDMPQPGPRQPPPPVATPQPQPQPTPRPWGGGGGRGGPPVIVQPAPQPQPPPRRGGGGGWGGSPPPPIYVPGPPVYRGPPPPVYRGPPPPVYREPPVIVGPGPGYGPPPQWRHRREFGWCRAKAERLHQFEYQMQMDGRVSRDEARIARSLRADLANSCGGGRWDPNRGWYYR